MTNRVRHKTYDLQATHIVKPHKPTLNPKLVKECVCPPTIPNALTTDYKHPKLGVFLPAKKAKQKMLRRWIPSEHFKFIEGKLKA